MRLLLALSALVLATDVAAQAVQTRTLPAQTLLAPSLEVQRLAPQLVTFAGGDANFQNLVNGLATGTQVSLASGNQLVSFTPAGTMNALQIAQTLESLRQSLITRGIAAPTPQQLATALVGGALPTALGATQVNGVVTTTTPVVTNTVQQSPAVAIQSGTGAAAAAGGLPIRGNTSDSPLPRGISDTPPAAIPGTTASPTPGTTTPAPAGSAALRTR